MTAPFLEMSRLKKHLPAGPLHICRYSGADNADNRKKCTAANCKIGGTASCPTGVNIKTCSAARPLDRLYQLATFAEERPQ